jgi:hypothetical protein
LSLRVAEEAKGRLETSQRQNAEEIASLRAEIERLKGLFNAESARRKELEAQVIILKRQLPIQITTWIESIADFFRIFFFLASSNWLRSRCGALS